MTSSLKKRMKPKGGLREGMLARMEAARLRFLNDEMYNDKKDVLKKKSVFKAYHESFRKQQQLWESNPLDHIVKDLKNLYSTSDKESFTIADMGCGDAKIAEEFEQTNANVHSIDFVATNKKVTACDMANTKIGQSSVDVVVFCLSLMSSKCNPYLKEAHRVLKAGGKLFIAEVASRIENEKSFVGILKEYGFSLYEKIDVSKGYFTYFKFKKISNCKSKPSDIVLLPCKYKKR